MRTLTRTIPAPLLLIETDAEAGGGFGLVPVYGAGGGTAGAGALSRRYLQSLYADMGVVMEASPSNSATSTIMGNQSHTQGSAGQQRPNANASAAASANVSSSASTGGPTWVTPNLNSRSIGTLLVDLVIRFPTMRLVRSSNIQRFVNHNHNVYRFIFTHVHE